MTAESWPLMARRSKALPRTRVKMAYRWLMPGAQKQGCHWGSIKVDARSNEVTAIPELLKTLEINGSLVTIDAMGCQKKLSPRFLKKMPRARSLLSRKARPMVVLSIAIAG